MPRHEQQTEDGSHRERGSAPRASGAASVAARRRWRLGVALLVALVGLGAILLAYVLLRRAYGNDDRTRRCPRCGNRRHRGRRTGRV